MDIKQDLLTVNPYSRPGDKLHKLRGLVLHWVGNPKTTAQFNRDFFEMRKDGEHGTGGAHLIVDLDGSVVQCVPFDELTHHAGPTAKTTANAKKWLGDYPNGCTIGIETCHLDWKGTYTPETYRSMIDLCVLLCKSYGLTEKDVYTHELITGKDCPRWFYDDPSRFARFLEEVELGLLDSP